MTASPSASYAESVRLLKDLHRLIAEGKGDEVEADAIRDAMEVPWYKMTQGEQRRIDDLSADLYALTDPQSDAPAASADARQALEDALSKEDWMRVLALLRDEPGLESHSRRAYLRAKAWTELGEVETGRRFLEQAYLLSTSPATPALRPRSPSSRRRTSTFLQNLPDFRHVDRRAQV